MRDPRFFALALSLGLSVVSTATAQTSPCTPETATAGGSEDRLAAIRVVSDSIEEVMRKLGNPSGRIVLPGEEGRGQIQYQWQQDGATLFVGTSYVTDASGSRAETIRTLQIFAPVAKSKWKTGRGIGLGAARKRVESSYGSNYQTTQENGQERLAYCFAGGSWLAFTMDGDGKVSRIHLEGPPE